TLKELEQGPCKRTDSVASLTRKEWEEPARPPPRTGTPPSRRAQALQQSFPWKSRKPGGRDRAGQRSLGRMVPKPSMEVKALVVEWVFDKRWQSKFRRPSPWRTRALAVIAAAMSVPRGTTIIQLCRMHPAEILKLTMPFGAWRWVFRWVGYRRVLE